MRVRYSDAFCRQVGDHRLGLAEPMRGTVREVARTQCYFVHALVAWDGGEERWVNTRFLAEADGEARAEADPAA